MVHRRRGRPTFYLKLPTRTGWVQRSTGTADRATAKAMARMLDELGPRGRRAWNLLDAVLDAVHDDRLTLGALYDAWRMNDLDGLRARMADEDLAEHIPAWRAWLGDRVKPSTTDRYVAHLRTLMPEGKPHFRSDFTGPVVTR